MLFFWYLWGLGFSVSFFIKDKRPLVEKQVMRLGIGLGVFVTLGVIINALGIPVDWRVFLVLASIAPMVVLIKQKGRFAFPKVKISKESIRLIAVLVLVLVSFFMYHKGSFSYPYLEDDDPWGHASSAKYVAVEKTLFVPEGKERLFQYLDPYPPGYSLVMGVLHQVSASISWTLKFFNTVIIVLGIAFFYFFARSFLNNANKALFATFVLFAIPSYLSHFI